MLFVIGSQFQAKQQTDAQMRVLPLVHLDEEQSKKLSKIAKLKDLFTIFWR